MKKIQFYRYKVRFNRNNNQILELYCSCCEEDLIECFNPLVDVVSVVPANLPTRHK